MTNTQVSRLRKSSTKNSSDNIKISKTQYHKIGQSGVFLGRHLGPLLQTGLPLMWNVLKPSATSISIPLGSRAAALATDEPILKKMFGSSTIPLIILT